MRVRTSEWKAVQMVECRQPRRFSEIRRQSAQTLVISVQHIGRFANTGRLSWRLYDPSLCSRATPGGTFLVAANLDGPQLFPGCVC